MSSFKPKETAGHSCQVGIAGPTLARLAIDHVASIFIACIKQRQGQEYYAMTDGNRRDWTLASHSAWTVRVVY